MTPPFTSGHEAGSGQDHNAVLRSMDFASFASTPITERRWIVDQWLPAGSVTALFGAGGRGKSLLAEQIAIVVANGINTFGKTHKGPVVGLFCEDDEAELGRRALRMFKVYGLDATTAGRDLHFVSRVGEQNGLVSFADRIAQSTELMIKLYQKCKAVKPSLVIIDNIAHVFTGNEIDRGQVTAFVNLLAGMARELDCAVLLIGHTAKALGSEYSGSTAWEAAVRTRLLLEQRSGGLVLRRAKANYAERDELQLEIRDGVFAPASMPVDVDPLLVSEAKKAVLKAVDSLTAKEQAASHLPTTRNFLPRLMADNGLLDGSTKQAARKALDALVADGALLRDQELPWVKPNRSKVRGLSRNMTQSSEQGA